MGGTDASLGVWCGVRKRGSLRVRIRSVFGGAWCSRVQQNCETCVLNRALHTRFVCVRCTGVAYMVTLLYPQLVLQAPLLVCICEYLRARRERRALMSAHTRTGVLDGVGGDEEAKENNDMYVYA